MTLKERASWILKDVIYRHALSNVKLAEILGSNPGTINNYRRMKSAPGVKFINAFCEEFNINPLWFLTGEGEPYIKEGEKGPEPGPSDEGKAEKVGRVAAPGIEYDSNK